MILTPSIVNGKNVIVGGINHPYIKVKGASTARAQSQASDEIISGESKYTILSQKQLYVKLSWIFDIFLIILLTQLD